MYRCGIAHVRCRTPVASPADALGGSNSEKNIAPVRTVTQPNMADGSWFTSTFPAPNYFASRSYWQLSD